MCCCFQKSSILRRMVEPLGCQKTSPPPASSCALVGVSCGVVGDGVCVGVLLF